MSGLRELQIPNVYRILAERFRSWNRAFEEFVERLCREEIVLEAYLVGSRARGDNLPYSDYDVVVVIPPTLDKLDVIVKLRLLRTGSFPLDLIALYPDELEDPLYREMLRYAKRICIRGES